MKLWVNLVTISLLCTACKTYDVTLEYSSTHPIQFGALNTTFPLDTLGGVVGTIQYHFEEDTYTENERTSFTISGDNEYFSNLERSIYQPLEKEKNIFFANSSINLRSSYGFKPISFLLGFVLSTITKSEMNPGTFTSHTVSHHGYLYKRKEIENHD